MTTARVDPSAFRDIAAEARRTRGEYAEIGRDPLRVVSATLRGSAAMSSERRGSR